MRHAFLRQVTGSRSVTEDVDTWLVLGSESIVVIEMQPYNVATQFRQMFRQSLRLFHFRETGGANQSQSEKFGPFPVLKFKSSISDTDKSVFSGWSVARYFPGSVQWILFSGERQFRHGKRHPAPEIGTMLLCSSANQRNLLI